MAGKYEAYPEYKDSGVEWVMEIPKSWKSISLGKVVQFMNNGSSATQVEESIDTVKVTRIETISGGIINKNKVGHVRRSDISSRYILKDGDIQFSNINSLSMIGNCAIYDINEQLYAGMNLLHIRPKLEYVNSMYMHFQFKTKYFRNLVEANAKPAINQASIPGGTLKQFTFICPPLEEQTQIANFLDHETAKIDALIEKQQQLIKLLKEKRQAVISHAVTKGLNPDAPMKDSGVEWLGEVPEHWDVKPLKTLCRFSGGGTPSKDNISYWVGGDIPWVSPKDMKTFWLSKTQDKLTTKAVSESSTNYVEKGSLLLVVRSGILQRTIPIAINTVQVTLNQDMKALKFNDLMSSEYAANYILGNTQPLLLEWSKEGATVESIEQEFLSNSLIPVPPQKEQFEINNEIQARMNAFDDLNQQASSAIVLMQERRTALISASVTGKIDVRKWKKKHFEFRSKNA